MDRTTSRIPVAQRPHIQRAWPVADALYRPLLLYQCYQNLRRPSSTNMYRPKNARRTPKTKSHQPTVWLSHGNSRRIPPPIRPWVESRLEFPMAYWIILPQHNDVRDFVINSPRDLLMLRLPRWLPLRDARVRPCRQLRTGQKILGSPDTRVAGGAGWGSRYVPATYALGETSKRPT